MSGELLIDTQRLWRSLMELAQIGAYNDPITSLTGVNRLALTDSDSQARRLVMAWLEQAGLRITIDEMGNIFGRREGHEPDLDPVMTGSHIDSVATAGAFDGCLGVLGALEVVRALNDADIRTRRPIVVAVWTEEEGVRFGTDMLGSAVAAGRLSLEYAHKLVDTQGLRLSDELRRIGFSGSRPARLPPPHAYVECHIEQGPLLARRDTPVGVVTGVQAISWQRVRLRGRAAHAGTTPTELRVDSGLAAAELITYLRELVNSGRYGQLRATVGQLRTSPGLPSVVPELAEVTIDLRNPDDSLQAQAEADVLGFLTSLPQRHPGLEIETQRMAKTGAVSFSQRVRDLIAEQASLLGFDPPDLMSGAGHDAQEIAAIAPTGMIFVRGQYDGISHSPREYSSPSDCAAGVTVLAHTIVKLSA